LYWCAIALSRPTRQPDHTLYQIIPNRLFHLASPSMTKWASANDFVVVIFDLAAAECRPTSFRQPRGFTRHL
jgi:hypothetical protein